MKTKSWKPNTPAAFRAWIKDLRPRILTRNGQYRVFKPTEHQDKTIDSVLASSNNTFKHSMDLCIEPRRHGKSALFALIVLWLFTSRRNYTIHLLGNSEQHVRRTMYNTIKNIITHTPLLRQSIPDSNIQQYSITIPALGNLVQISAYNVSASFGDRINLLWVSDLHAAVDVSPFNALQATLLDSDQSLCLIDSNVDHTDGPVHGLQMEAASDPTMYCHHLQYKNFEDYDARAPLWIDRTKARRLQRTTLPTDFARDILGRRLDAQNALFASDVISLCKSPYKTPVSDIQSLAQGRTYKVGGGLDRSKSLFAGPVGDHTVWSTIMKVASPQTGEPEYFILNQVKIVPNISRSIKKIILKDHERYRLDNVVLENYEVSDLAPWLSDQRIPYELVSATDTAQNASFPEFYRIASEGRFHFPSDLKDMASEMATFSYTQRPGGSYRFSHQSKKFKDDHVYSTNWAIFALRSAVMTLYSLGHVMCTLLSPRKKYCYVMGGNLQLHCSSSCDAHQRIEEMFQNYKQMQMDSELTIAEFLQYKVKRVGARISQSA
jgi:hypothetical protein